jgi:uncharacterized protein YkwD
LLRLLLVAATLLPATALGQAAEENVRESTRALVKPAKGARVPDLGEVSALVVRGVNALRETERSAPLAIDRRLMMAAEDFAGYMARTDRYGHQVDGRRPAERAGKRGYDYCIVSENIAYQFSSAGFTSEELAARLVRSWRSFRGHQRNLLDPDVTDTGVAIVRSDQTGHHYAVQLGRPSRSRPLPHQQRIGRDGRIRNRRRLSLPPRFARSHEQCRGVELVIAWPDRMERTRLRPANGDRYSITRTDSQLVLRKL